MAHGSVADEVLSPMSDTSTHDSVANRLFSLAAALIIHSNSFCPNKDSDETWETRFAKRVATVEVKKKDPQYSMYIGCQRCGTAGQFPGPITPRCRTRMVKESNGSKFILC